jgi:hypothetical protein
LHNPQVISCRFLLLFVLACLLLRAGPSEADWINLTGAENAPNIAEIYVEQDRIRVQLEICIQDLMEFAELIPDDFFGQPIPGRPGQAERTGIFAREKFQIITDVGQNLAAEVALVEPRMRIERPSPFAGTINPYTRQTIPGPPEDKRVLYVELSYPFEGQPKSLAFIPPLDEKGLPQVSIGFLCYHLGVPVVDFRHLSVRNVLRLDWEDPWYSEFEAKQLKRTLQSGVRTYLYIEPYEVRQEILVRVKDLMAWMAFDLRGGEWIEKDEFNPLREQVGRFFLERENVRIDGKRLKPILDRTAFVESSTLRSRFIEIPERVPLNTAMVGVIITYLTDGIPQEVTAEWNLFSDRVQKVTARMTDPAGPFPYDLEPGDNVLKWTNYLKTYTIPTVEHVEVASRHRGVLVPVGSVACLGLLLPAGWGLRRRRRAGKPARAMLGLVGILVAGALILIPVLQVSVGRARAGQVAEEDAKAILHGLLENIYRAFDFRDESDVYDKLAISASGDLLTDIYLEHRRSMAIQQAGGAQGKVMYIEILAAEVADSQDHDGALAFRAQWSILGTVGHWGHIHTRQNRYDAILTLAPVDGAWKLIDLELIEEQRMEPYAPATPSGTDARPAQPG